MRVGIVSEVDPATVMAKVTFDDQTADDSDALLSDWMQIVQHGSAGDCGYWLPTVGSLVLCDRLESSEEDWFILGSLYNEADTPPASGLGKWYHKFSDGTTIEYDPIGGITIETPLTVAINGAAVNIEGAVNITGAVIATGRITGLEIYDALGNVRD